MPEITASNAMAIGRTLGYVLTRLNKDEALVFSVEWDGEVGLGVVSYENTCHQSLDLTPPLALKYDQDAAFRQREIDKLFKKLRKPESDSSQKEPRSVDPQTP